jgi:hypothetical protein
LAQVRAEQARRRKALAKKRKRDDTAGRAGTPPPVVGRRHMDVQTETLLEELSDRVPEVEMGTQTEAFMDRPPTPLFMPSKTGEDKATQILPGDLFDFDAEVEPILEVLVGKTLEQGMMEVLEEEELSAIRAHQEEFEQIRNSELAEVQRLEGEVRRREAEKQRRLTQERERVKRAMAAKQKVAAAAFARQYLTGLRQDVFTDMVEGGYFEDPLTREVESNFMPWLMTAVGDELSNRAVAAQASDDLVNSLLSAAANVVTADQERLAVLRAEEEARRKEEEEAERLRLAAEEEERKRREAEEGEEED